MIIVSSQSPAHFLWRKLNKSGTAESLYEAQVIVLYRNKKHGKASLLSMDKLIFIIRRKRCFDMNVYILAIWDFHEPVSAYSGCSSSIIDASLAFPCLFEMLTDKQTAEKGSLKINYNFTLCKDLRSSIESFRWRFFYRPEMIYTYHLNINDIFYCFSFCIKIRPHPY